MAIINPHTSMVFHDPDSKDANNYQNVNRREKGLLIEKYLNQWKGTQQKVVHVKSGEVRTMDFNLDSTGYPTRRSYVQTVHFLFGDWRRASPDDIERQAKKDRIQSNKIARIEAARAAQKAGIMFSELTQASKAINDFNAAQEAEKVAIKAAQAQIEAEDREKESKGAATSTSPKPKK